MKDEKYIYVGYDICSEYTQISCLKAEENVPDAIGTSDKETGILIPTALCCIPVTGEWLFGEDAVWARENKKGVYVNDFISHIYKGSNEVFGKDELTAYELLEKFIVRTLNLIKQKYSNRTIANITVASPVLNTALEEAFKGAFLKAGIEDDRLNIATYTDCFIHYVLNMQGENLTSNSIVFDKQTYDFTYTSLLRGAAISSDEKKIISAKKGSFKEEWQLICSKENDLHKEQLLFELLVQKLEGKNIEFVFFTGAGLDEEWINEALKRLCGRRRIFKGRNLYTRGAVFLAKDLKNKSDRIFKYFNVDMIDSSIAIRNVDEEETVLIPAGSFYNKINVKKRIILTKAGTIDFYVYNYISGIKKVFSFIPENAAFKSKDIVQLMITVTMPTVNTVIVKVNDLGFTSLFKSSHRVWEKHFEI